MDFDGLGKLLVIAGAAILLLGIILIFAGRSGFLSGLLQSGTLRFEGGGLTCVVPIIASILLSIALTIIVNLAIRFLNK